jgi:hypothetical protein
MSDAEILQYLANILLIVGADDKVVRPEGRAMEGVLREVGAGVRDLDQAAEFIHQGNRRVTPTGRLSDKVRNLEDMVLVALSDGELPDSEKKLILEFVQAIGLGKAHLTQIVAEARKRLGMEPKKEG